MFDFIKNIGKNKQLEEIIGRIENNASNNYKDAAQQALWDYEAALEQLKSEGKLSDKQKAYYEKQLAAYKVRMQKFTHKDQKPTWV